MTKEQLEYWHEQLDLLLTELGKSPADTTERQRWGDVVLHIADLRVALRRMHGDWKNTESYRHQVERLPTTP